METIKLYLYESESILQQSGIYAVYNHFPERNREARRAEDDEREMRFRAENNATGMAERRNPAVRNFRNRKVDRKSSRAQVTRASSILPDVVLSPRGVKRDRDVPT